MQPKFMINATDRFDSRKFPSLDTNLGEIETGLAFTPSLHKAEMLVSFLKNHSMQTAFVAVNPVAAKLIASGTLPTKFLEDLFESSKHAQGFSGELEGYIQHKLKASTVTY